jgi:hypothetical protein
MGDVFEYSVSAFIASVYGPIRTRVIVLELYQRDEVGSIEKQKISEGRCLSIFRFNLVTRPFIDPFGGEWKFRNRLDEAKLD